MNRWNDFAPSHNNRAQKRLCDGEKRLLTRRTWYT